MPRKYSGATKSNQGTKADNQKIKLHLLNWEQSLTFAHPITIGILDKL
jgi:hypothetical protein